MPLAFPKVPPSWSTPRALLYRSNCQHQQINGDKITELKAPLHNDGKVTPLAGALPATQIQDAIVDDDLDHVRHKLDRKKMFVDSEEEGFTVMPTTAKTMRSGQLTARFTRRQRLTSMKTSTKNIKAPKNTNKRRSDLYGEIPARARPKPLSAASRSRALDTKDVDKVIEDKYARGIRVSSESRFKLVSHLFGAGT